jgi:hypothetical protein
MRRVSVVFYNKNEKDRLHELPQHVLLCVKFVDGPIYLLLPLQSLTVLCLDSVHTVAWTVTKEADIL